MLRRNTKREILREKNKKFLPYFSLALVLIITIGIAFLFYQNSITQNRLKFEVKTTSLNSKIEEDLTNRVLALDAAKYFFPDSEKKSSEFIFPVNGETGYFEYSGEENFYGANFANFETKNKSQKKVLEKLEFSELIKSARKKELIFTKLDSPDQSNYLFLLPIYRKKNLRNGIGSNFRGFIFHIFSKSDLVVNKLDINEFANIGFSIRVNEKTFLNYNSKPGIIKTNNFLSEKKFETSKLEWNIIYQALPGAFSENIIFQTALISVSGIFIGLILFILMRDETISKEKIAQIAEDLAESERKRKELLEKEQAARKQAERSNQVKDEFISLISHEIRTPLNSINGWTRILQSDDINTATKNRGIRTIQKNIRTQSKIIDDLLLFSDLTKKENKINHRLNGISRIIEDAMVEVSENAKKENIALIKDNNLNGVEIYCDRAKLKKVFVQLLQNALKFTPRGGVVNVKGRKKEDLICLTIKDSGQGIEKSYLPHIFEKFYQTSSSLTTRKFGGLGLGLTIANQIVKLHGGKIKVKSEGKDKGAEFEIQLPRQTSKISEFVKK